MNKPFKGASDCPSMPRLHRVSKALPGCWRPPTGRTKAKPINNLALAHLEPANHGLTKRPAQCRVERFLTLLRLNLQGPFLMLVVTGNDFHLLR